MKNISVIPYPKKHEYISDNTLKVSPSVIVDNEKWSECAEVFGGYIKKLFDINISDCMNGIELITDETIQNDEYIIDTSDGIKLYASAHEGMCYALSTLLQIIEADKESNKFIVPDIHIEDKPDKEYRGFMVDLSRCWHPFETVLCYMDICYMYKIKYVHLHFVDNELYTLPSKIFPRLSSSNHYSFEEIEQMNKYAKDRGLIIVPEFEVPGHAKAMNLAYPEIFGNQCTDSPDNNLITETGAVVSASNVVCVGSEKSVNAIKELIKEVIEMFPDSPYIHIGGDEVNTNVWNTCPNCIDYMKNNNIADAEELYADFVARIAQFVIDCGKTPIVWEGFAEEHNHKIPKETIVIAWESHYQTADKLLKDGFRIINCSWQPLYVVPSLTECWGAKDILNWNVYNWQHWWEKSEARLNPINVAPTEKVLGAQLCAWEQSYEMEVGKVVENLAALSERCWNLKRKADDSQIFTGIRLLKKRVGRIITR